MSVIYKPLRQRMSPNAEIINPSVSNTFSAIVDGQQCIAYRVTVRDMDNNTIAEASTDRINLDSIKYNGDAVSVPIAANSLVAGNQYKWNIDMYGRDVTASTIATALTVSSVDTTNYRFTIASGALKNGSVVCVSATTTMPAPIEAGVTYYAACEDGTVDSTAVVFVYLYDSYTKAVNMTDPIQITSAGSGTIKIIVNDPFVCNNHNFETGDTVFIDTVPNELSSTMSTFKQYYVRKIDKDRFRIYNYLEGAKNNDGSVAMPYGDGFNIKFSNVAVSEYVLFKAYSVPTITFVSTTITSPSYMFSPVYNHPEGIIVNHFKVLIRNDYNDDIFESETVYRSKLEYQYDELLNGHTYYVKFDITNNVGQENSTGYTPFEINYSASSIGVQPVATNMEDNACVNVSWPEITQIVGSLAGSKEYISDYVSTGNYGLHLMADSLLRYSGLNKTESGSLPMFGWSPATSDWSGTIFKMSSTATGKQFELSYASGYFYVSIDGVRQVVLHKQIVAKKYYYIGIVGSSVYIVDGPSNVW